MAIHHFDTFTTPTSNDAALRQAMGTFLTQRDMPSYIAAMDIVRSSSFLVAYNATRATANGQRSDCVSLQELGGGPAIVGYDDGLRFFPVFTEGRADEIPHDGILNYNIVLWMPFARILDIAQTYKLDGILINHFSDNFPIPAGVFDNVRTGVWE